MCVAHELLGDSVSCKSYRGTCTPKVSWDRASDMLKGDMMTFGCSGVVCRFCSSCTPSLWMEAAMASLDSWLRPMVWQPSSCSSSDESTLGELVVAITVAFVVSAISGCAVFSLSTFCREKQEKMFSSRTQFQTVKSEEQCAAVTGSVSQSFPECLSPL